MRYGFTTGSCAAAASKAAAYMLLTGKEKKEICIQTPKGVEFVAQIVDTEKSENSVSCSVLKDGGDDPDVTTGAHIRATVCILNDSAIIQDRQNKDTIKVKNVHNYEDLKIEIDGGRGVGRVTKPGLDQPVGAAAINHVPREMIAKEVREICQICDYWGPIHIEISVPEGEEIAGKTFNPRLGIVGGISILGTSGIVEPMSSQALLETIKVELMQKKALGNTSITVALGNYGADYMRKTYGIDLNMSVKCSNFIGETIDIAAELGFKKMLLIGHIGKLVKVAGGIMNTHSREADCRMEIMATAALMSGADRELMMDIMKCTTTEEVISIINKKAGDNNRMLEKMMEYLINKIHYYLNKRADEKVQVECILYSNDYGELAKSEKVGDIRKWYIS